MPPQIHVKSVDEERSTFLPNSSQNISIPSTKSPPLKLDTSQESNRHLGHSPDTNDEKKPCCLCSFHTLSYFLVLLLGIFIGSCMYTKTDWFRKPTDSSNIPAHVTEFIPEKTLVEGLERKIKHMPIVWD